MWSAIIATFVISFIATIHFSNVLPFEINSNDSCDSVEGRKSCACVLRSKNESISLWNITLDWNRAGKPRFQANDSINWFYSFNPCLDFSLFENQTHRYPGYRPCKNVAVARWTTESVHRCDNLGSQADGKFHIQPSNISSHRSSNLTLEFRNPSPKYGAVVSLICNETLPIGDSIFNYLGVINKPLTTYYFELESLCCCPGACVLPPPRYPNDNGLSLWWIFAVVIGVLIIIAVIAAVILEMRKRRVKTGPEKPLLTPNPSA